MAVYDSGGSTPEWLCRILGKELQDQFKEGNWRTNTHPTGVAIGPIGRIPSDPDNGSYLCPNDVLLGRASSTVPQGPFRHTKNPRHRVEFVQKIVDSFWTRWTRDVFPSLLPRKQWHTEKCNVQVDDFVIVQTSSAIRGTWNVGRVVNVYPGQDGKVRNVKVKTRTGEYERPITKITVIYPAEGYKEHDK